jgi:hypothetical protein
MRQLRNALLLIVLIGTSLIPALAADKFGVPIYEAAKFDAEVSAQATQMGGGQAACYRSPATLAKVIDFYSKQPGVNVVHTGPKGAMFKLKGVTITLQSPWLDMKTGTRSTDTLISIVKH